MRKVAVGLLDDCLECLSTQEHAPADAEIHHVRQRLRQLRALLQLIRPVLHSVDFRRENHCFREAGRKLTPVRDAAVRVECLRDVLGAMSLDELERSQIEAILQTWQNRRNAEYDLLLAASAFGVLREDLVRAQKRVKLWSSVPDRWRTLGRGLQATYERARDRRAAIEASLTPQTLHAWRKTMRCLHRQLELVRFLDPPRVRQLAAEAGHINKLLGDARDLRMVSDGIVAAGVCTPELESRCGLWISQKIANSIHDAMNLAVPFLEHSPADWTRRLKQQWTTRR